MLFDKPLKLTETVEVSVPLTVTVEVSQPLHVARVLLVPQQNEVVASSFLAFIEPFNRAVELLIPVATSVLTVGARIYLKAL